MGSPTPRPLSYHRDVLKKDLPKLSNQDRARVEQTIAALADDANLQTHALIKNLKGWYSTKASRGHRVVHRPDPEVPGGIEIGYVGLHEYQQAINRLTKRQAGLNGALPADLVIRHIPVATALAGAEMGRLVAANDQEAFGYLDYGLDRRRGRIFIHAVAVAPGQRRRGIATALLARLRSDYPGWTPDPGYTSDAGEAWWQSAASRKVAVKVGVMNRKIHVNGMDQVLCPTHYGNSAAESAMFNLRPVHQGLTDEPCTRCAGENRAQEAFERNNAWLSTYMGHTMTPLTAHPGGTGMMISQCSDCGAQAYHGPHITDSGGDAERRPCRFAGARTASRSDYAEARYT